MPVAWFLCSYRIYREHDQDVRRPKVYQYVPAEPDLSRLTAANPRWEAAELLGGGCVIKVSAPALLLAQIEIDAQIVRVPHDADPIPPARRPAILTRLEALGYDMADTEIASWRPARLLRRLVRAAGVPRSQDYDHLEDRLPG